MDDQLLLSIIKGTLLLIISLWIAIIFSIEYRRLTKRKRRIIKKSYILFLSANFLQKESKFNKAKHPYLFLESSFFLIADYLAAIKDFFKVSDNKWLTHTISNEKISKKLNRDLYRNNWFLKTRALWLSYELDIPLNIEKTIKLSNHHRVHTRREAQISLIRFLGWKALHQLTLVKYPISLWQQIRIIEKLHYYHPNPDLDQLNECMQSNILKINELTLRIIQSFQIEEGKPFIFKCLSASNLEITKLALKISTEFTWTKSELLKIEKATKSISLSMKFSQFPRYKSILESES
jgi:uncharacterized protein (UPF0128 family)